jgi:hypothetical protein
MSELDANEYKQRLFDKTRDDLLQTQRSNSDAYDKALLTLSSTFLGISLAFIKDIIHLQDAVYRWSLFASWFCFALTIVLVIISYMYGQRLIKRLLDAAKRYYLHGEMEAYAKSKIASKSIERINELSGVTFILAVFLSVGFVWCNTLRGNDMSQNDKPKIEPEIVRRSQPIPEFIEIPETPTTTTTEKPSQDQSGSSESGSGNSSERE